MFERWLLNRTWRRACRDLVKRPEAAGNLQEWTLAIRSCCSWVEREIPYLRWLPWVPRTVYRPCLLCLGSEHQVGVASWTLHPGPERAKLASRLLTCVVKANLYPDDLQSCQAFPQSTECQRRPCPNSIPAQFVCDMPGIQFGRQSGRRFEAAC